MLPNCFVYAPEVPVRASDFRSAVSPQFRVFRVFRGAVVFVPFCGHRIRVNRLRAGRSGPTVVSNISAFVLLNCFEFRASDFGFAVVVLDTVATLF